MSGFKKQSFQGPTVPTVDAPPPSVGGSYRVYVDTTLGDILISIDGGPFGPIGGGLAASGWTDDGTVVRLDDPTDQVGIGTALPPASTKTFITDSSGVLLEALGVELVGELDSSAAVRASHPQSGMLPNDAVMGFACAAIGNGGDDPSSIVLSFGADLPSRNASPGVLAAFGLRGDPLGVEVYDAAIVSLDNDIGIQSARSAAGAPAEIVILSSPSFAPLDSSAGVTIASGNADTAVAADITLTPGADVVTGMGGAHGTTRVAFQAPDQVGLTVDGSTFAFHSGDLMQVIEAGGNVVMAVQDNGGPSVQLRDNGIGQSYQLTFQPDLAPVTDLSIRGEASAVGALPSFTFEDETNLRFILGIAEGQIAIDSTNTTTRIIDRVSGNSFIEFGDIAAIPQLGFYGAAVVPKPSAVGSRVGNAALASLLTALASLGLIVDATTP